MAKRSKTAAPKQTKLGARVRDSVTGFNGVAVGRAVHLHDATQVGIESSDGTRRWFTEGRIEKTA